MTRTTEGQNVQARGAREQAGLGLGTGAGRWLIAASALGSGLAFLDSTVVNVALPAIRRELGGGLSVQEWVLDGYLLTLSDACRASVRRGRCSRIEHSRAG